MDTILITKENWMDSQLSPARHYGGIKIDWKEYVVTLPYCDLLRAEYLKLYNFFGRDEFISLLTEKLTKKQMEELMDESKKKEKQIINQLNLEL